MDIPNGRGVPQGISVSSILADRYLKDLDEKYLAPHFNGHVCFVRYVDDILVFSSDKEIHKRVKKETLFNLQADYGLQINTDKISEGNLSENSVDFLGTSINNRRLCISDAQMARVKKQLDDLFMWYRRVSKTRNHPLYAKKDRALKSLTERLNLLITGYIYQNTAKSKKSRYGWIQTSLPRQIDNVDALKILDKYVTSLIHTHIQDEEQRKNISQNRKSFYMAFCKSKFTTNEDGYILDREKISKDEDAMYQITCNVMDVSFSTGNDYRYIRQEIKSYSAGDFIRVYSNGTWSNWEKIIRTVKGNSKVEGMLILNSNIFGTELPAAGNVGRLFLVEVS